MKHHTLTQGTPEWHAHRAAHFNASDAPAMMGCSPYKTREQLIRERLSGEAQHVGTALQNVFDEGHRYEYLSRSVAEQILGEDLFPVVGTSDQYSASFDGINMAETVVWEHKSINAELREYLPESGIGHINSGDLFPRHYRVQMEQQLMVSGADRALFTASAWDEEGKLLDMRHAWYYQDLALRREIILGWEQFERDCQTYQARPAAPEGRAPEALPALFVHARGEVTNSNIDAFKARALEVIRGINRKLDTDKDFADAEKATKFCTDVESRIASAKDAILAQTTSIDAALKMLGEISEEARRVRLDLEKLVKSRKEQIRLDLIREFQDKLAAHVATLNAAIGAPLMPNVQAAFAEVVKGKRTVDSTRDALAAELLRCMGVASDIQVRISDNLVVLRKLPDSLVPDLASLITQDPAAVAAIAEQRVRKAEDEAAARRQRDAEAAEAEQRRQMEEAHQREQGQKHESAAVANQAPQFVARSDSASGVFANSTGQEPATLNVSAIGQRLGFTLSADAIASLGIQPAARERSSVKFTETQWLQICDALVRRIQQVRNPVAKAA